MPASRHASAAGKRAETTAVAIALSLFIAAAQSALAQQAPDGPPAAWRVECSGDGKTLDCRAVQQVFHRETRQLVVSVLVRPAADGKSAAMVITLPLGLNLTEPVLVKVDNGAAERQSIQTCTNVGCFVAMTLTDKPAVVASEPFRQEVIAGVGRRLLLRDVRVPAVPTFTPVEDSFRRPAPRRARARRHR